MISKSHSSQQNIPQTSKCAPTRAYFVYGGFILEDAEVFHSYPNMILLFVQSFTWQQTTGKMEMVRPGGRDNSAQGEWGVLCLHCSNNPPLVS